MRRRKSVFPELLPCQRGVTIAPMPTVTVKMSEVQFRALEREARARRKSKASLLRDAFLHSTTQARTDGSAFDLISDLVGSVKGPRDLATSPKFMRGYGRERAKRQK